MRIFLGLGFSLVSAWSFAAEIGPVRCQSIFSVELKRAQSIRVSEPVLNLYKSIPENLGTQQSPLSIEPGISITDTYSVRGKDKTIFSQINIEETAERNKMSAFFERSLYENIVYKKVITGRSVSYLPMGMNGYGVTLKDAFFDYATMNDSKSPRWLNPPGVVELVPERGIPINLFMNLRALKILGVKYGELKQALISNVRNIETSAQMASQEKSWKILNPGKVPSQSEYEDFFRHTSTYNYVEALLIQSGHRITSVRISNIMKNDLKSLLAIDKDTPERRKYFERIASQYGLVISYTDRNSSSVPIDFQVIFELEPFG